MVNGRLTVSKKYLLPILMVFVALIQIAAANTPPTVRINLPSGEHKPGETISATVSITFGSGLHAYQNPPTEPYMIPVTVESGNSATQLKSVRYPRGVDKIVGGVTDAAAVYSGTIQVPVEIVVPNSPGSHEISIKVGYQQCDATTCYAPGSVTGTATIRVSAPAATPPPAETPTQSQPQERDPVREPVETPQTTTEVTPEPIEEPVADEGAAGIAEGMDENFEETEEFFDGEVEDTGEIQLETEPTNMQPENEGLAATLVSAFESRRLLPLIGLCLLIGVFLAATPCVYPMIPITVSYFSNQSAKNPAGRFGLGALYALGIGFTYGAVGGIFAVLGGTVGELFTKPWFLLALSALMVFLALSMFDLYEIRIPNFIAKKLKSRAGPVGAFIMGLLMGFAAAPCAGAFISALAVAVAEAGSIPLGLLTFTSVGIGIGLPFLALASLSAGSAKALPKSGGWLKTVKAILGLVVLWLAYDYLLKGLGFRVGEPNTQVAWIVFYLGAALYLILFEKGGDSRIAVGMKATAALTLGILAGMAFTERSHTLFERELIATGGSVNRIAWVKFDDPAFEEAKASGRPIFIDGTADWCVKCREIEQTILNTPRGITALGTVETLKIDHSTGVDEEYKRKTTEQFNIRGLPHIVVLKPGGEPYMVLNEIKSIDHLEEILRGAGAEF